MQNNLQQIIAMNLANRQGETEAQSLARVLPIWNALPYAQQCWFPAFAVGLQQRLKAQYERDHPKG
jgi:hypothetical protein